MDIWKRFGEKEVSHSMAHYLQAVASLKGEKGHVLLAFEERRNVLYGLIPFDFLHSLRHKLAPVCGGQLGSSPTGLG